MLETGVQSKILLAKAIEGSTASDLALKLGTWLNNVSVVIHDMQIFQSQDKWVAMVLFRK